jgi:hypothetical protein
MKMMNQIIRKTPLQIYPSKKSSKAFSNKLLLSSWFPSFFFTNIRDDVGVGLQDDEECYSGRAAEQQ